MQRHGACSRGKGGQGLDPHRVWGVPSSARRPPVGGCGSPPRWRRQPVKKERGCGGEEGHGVHAGRGGGGGLWAGWRARARGGGVAVCSAASATVRLTGEEGRPGLAKVGRGARGARGAGGHGQRRGPHPLGGDESRRASSTGANPGGGGGSATPSPRGRTGPGRAPPDGYRGGGRGWAPGLQGPGPWWLWAGAGGTGRASGLRLVRGGVEGPGGLGGEPREAPRSWARAPEGGRSLGGGGGCSLPGGRRGPLLSEGGGRACIARCRAMSIHGRAAWDYIPNPPRRSPFCGGAEGGGGVAVVVCTHPCEGGVAGGSSVRLGRETRWRPLGSWAPSRKNLGFAGGDSAIWYGMVWYGMVWYGMVWYGMVWYGMVWYGMVWYGMVWYGMVWYGTSQLGFGGSSNLQP